MKNKIIGFLICLILIFTLIPLSHANINFRTNTIDNTWVKTYGKFFNEEMGLSIKQTSDDGFIVVGIKSASFLKVYGNRDIWLLKLDETGSIIWDKTFGGIEDDFGNSILQTSDGGYIIAGETDSYSNGRSDVWLIKTDENGNMQWDKTYGYEGSDFGEEIIKTSDGGYVIVGWGNQTGGARGDAILIKVDSNGNKLWYRTFGGKGHNYADGVRETSDNGFIVLGSSWMSGDTDGYDVWLIKTDQNGNIQWEKKYDNSDSDHGWSIDLTSDGGFILTGETNHGSDNEMVWIIKTDENGNKLWDKTYAGRGFSIKQTTDNGFIITGGFMYPRSNDFSDGLLLKTDMNGNMEWEKTFGQSGTDFLFSVSETDDEGYIVTGYDMSIVGFLGPDLWIIKTDSKGDV